MLGAGPPSLLHSLWFLLHQQLILPFCWTESEQLIRHTIKNKWMNSSIMHRSRLCITSMLLLYECLHVLPLWMNVLFLTCCFCLLLSFCTAPTLCLLLVSGLQSYSQWDSTDLPLCEAYCRRDSWASPGSSSSSTQGEREEVDGPPSQDTNPQHHLNGHGTASTEKSWGGNWTLTGLSKTCAQFVHEWFGWCSFCYTL